MLLQFATCVIHRDEVHGRAFVVALPTDKVERASLAALAPQLGPCLPKGMQVRFSPSGLKAVFSEALYRETERAASAAPTTQIAGNR